MLCCSNCFGDKGLTKDIVPIYAQETGQCSYCNSQNEKLLQPILLKNYFELVISVYVPDDSGKPLVEWLKEDWALFDILSDHAHAKELLAEILDDGEIVRKRFIPSEICRSNKAEVWKNLRIELMQKNRYFPETSLDRKRLKELIDHLYVDLKEVDTTWYRARIQKAKSAFEIKDMMAPPKHLATPGRANPAGIPYLYLASTPETAVCEIRPHTGEFISIADFSLASQLKVVDLRCPRRTVSPFVLSDEREVALLQGDIEFLTHLGDELTRPVIPDAAAIDYIPSQYLCELIKNCGYDGVIYASSVGAGINLALFNPSKAHGHRVRVHQVSRVSVDITCL